MEKVSLIILNYNGNTDTLECLRSLENLSLPSNIKLEIIVVDNASSQNPNKIIRSQFRNVVVIENKINLGFSGGNNVGISYALDNGADYILIINNDTIVDKYFLDELLKVIKNREDVGIVVPKIYFAPGFEFHKNKYKRDDLGKVFWYAGGIMDFKNVIGSHRGVDEVDDGQYDKTQESDFASGCCMMIKREVFEKIGLLDDKYFLYYEDNDFSIRAKKEGFKIVYSPKAVIWHKNAGSAGGSGSSLQDYYITRNRMLFGFKYASIRVKFALFKESLNLLLTGRRWQKKAVIDFYLQRFGKGSFRYE